MGVWQMPPLTISSEGYIFQRLLLNLSRPNHDVQEMKFRHAAVGTVMFMFP